ncbi:hypothetical protein BFJ68_g11430 [Fusarium oxysporum]|uniref:NmrA-like domain-containing protein n=1 Tax=Fusarium oxysporum TaxID=5507 RepID=A0A420QG04_FUSOX|nr:hypothetical protein BFJ68_g11430 [Fusarium oxysporum]
MEPCKVLTVFGITGSQGGSVARSLLKNKVNRFVLRGITRNLNSDQTKALSAEGVDMVQADGLIPEQMAQALEGSWGVFVNLPSDDPSIGKPNGPSETDVGMAVVDAAVKAGVQHFVFSGMVSAIKITNGAVPNPSFDEKHSIAEYAKGKNFKSVVVVSPGWYMENHLVQEAPGLFGGFPFLTDEEGYVTLRFPRWGGNEEMPFVSIEHDYGDIVNGVFQEPEKYHGQLIQGISESAPASRMAEAFETATGRRCRFIPDDDWESFDTRGQRALEGVKYTFGFCQYSGGLYYGKPNDLAMARMLKRVAKKVQGESGGELMILKRFFSLHFVPSESRV